MFKTSFKAALLASAFAGLAATAALADEAVVTPAPMAPVEEPASPWTVGGTVGFTTNYMFRGFTQTGDDPAIFGSFDVGHESGLYAGIWASSINGGYSTPDANGLNDDGANLEFDFYAGFANSINAFSYDVGAVYYMYPGANEATPAPGDPTTEANYYEFYMKTGYDFGFFSIKDGIYYSPDFGGQAEDSLYGYGGMDVPLPFLPFGMYLTGQIGYNEFLDTTFADDYWDYQGGVGASVWGFDMTAMYIGTMGIGPTSTLTSPKGEANDDAFSFTVSRSF